MEQIIANLLADFEQGKMTRRQLVQNLAAAAATLGGTGAAMAQAQPYVAKATQLNHISYMVKDYKKTRDFYAGLFGMRVTNDNGFECMLNVGATQIAIGAPEDGLKPPIVDHIGLTIAGWDTDKSVPEKFLAETKRRGLKTKQGGGNGTPGSHSYHVYDPDGYDIQVGGVIQGAGTSAKAQGH